MPIDRGTKLMLENSTYGKFSGGINIEAAAKPADDPGIVIQERRFCGFKYPFSYGYWIRCWQDGSYFYYFGPDNKNSYRGKLGLQDEKSGVAGVCCWCGYAGDEEKPCLYSDDDEHCECWCDGSDERCDECSMFETKFENWCSFNHRFTEGHNRCQYFIKKQEE